MADCDEKLGAAGNIFVRSLHFKKAGDVMRGHVHVFDHMHLVAHGAVRVTVNGQSSDFSAPALILIKAGYEHGMQALVDGTVSCCLHALKNAEATEILDPEMVPKGVNPITLAASLTCDR